MIRTYFKLNTNYHLPSPAPLPRFNQIPRKRLDEQVNITARSDACNLQPPLPDLPHIHPWSMNIWTISCVRYWIVAEIWYQMTIDFYLLQDLLSSLIIQDKPVEQSITVLVLIILKMEEVFKEFLQDKYGNLGASPSNIIIHCPPYQE